MNETVPALRRAYALGQKYWQQADSDFARDNRKADETQAKFNQLVESMQGWLSPAEADNLRTQLAEAQKDLERWRWLRDHARIFRQSPDMSGNHYWMVHATTTLRGPTLDAAIDIAINAKQGESNGSN